MSDLRLAAVAAMAGIAARLAHLAAIRGHPFREFWRTWAHSDMHQFAAWARHLAGGDWLDANSFRPWFEWQQAIAPPEVWNSWYGAGVYYQPPLYPYFLAAGQALLGGLDRVRVLQLLLGGVNCGLVALLAARLHDRRAGWIAGLIAALYAPFIVYDAELLRGTLVMTTQLALLLALLAAVREAEGSLRRRSAVAGVAFGAAFLAESSILLFLPAALAWLAWSLGRAAGSRAARVGTALLLAGLALGVAPLVVRNLAVGAPMLSTTTRGPLAFVMGNAPDARPAGAMIPGSAGAILRESGYRMGATIGATLRRFNGDYAALLRLQAEKLRCLFGAYEVPDNPSLYYAARLSPIVRYGIWFLPVASLGLAGLALSAAASRRDPAAALLPLYVTASAAVFLLANVVSRYRQTIAMALIVLAAGAASRALRRGGRAPLMLTAAATLVSLLLPWGPPAGYGRHRPAEFVIAARIFAQRGDRGGAVEELREGARLLLEQQADRTMAPMLIYEAGLIQSEAGLREEAAAAFREALKLDPGLEEARRALREVEGGAAGGVPER